MPLSRDLSYIGRWYHANSERIPNLKNAFLKMLRKAKLITKTKNKQKLHYRFRGSGGGPILPSPVSTFFCGGIGGTLKPPLSFWEELLLLWLPPTCVKVPDLNHRSSSALRLRLNSACTLGSTSSSPYTGVKAMVLAVPLPPSEVPMPEERRPFA